MPSEAQARITINKLLEAAGWRFLPDSQGRPATIVCEHRVTRKAFAPNLDLGRDYEHAPQGFVDYLLLGADGRPVAVVEAKKESVDPLSAKEQARDYALSLGVGHIYLSNGLAHHYWNLRQGQPTRVSRFLPADQLGKTATWRPDPAALASVVVEEDYIAVSQDSAWRAYAPAERERVAKDKKIRLLRDYQLRAVRALQQAARTGRHRFLFEMATGTGKTLLSAALAKLYLRGAQATRVLFLVDRLELETQAWKNFRDYLAADGIETVIYKQKREDWRAAQVVVTTVQSLAARGRYLSEFAPTDFQLLISDEAHRTINGNARAIFEYFVGAKLGLTATPRDYLKGVDDDLAEDDPRAWERRLLLDTYRTFGCEDGEPTFRFSLLDAVRAKPKPYLCNPVALDARTDITTQLLADQGYAVRVPADDDSGQETELVFTGRDFERRFFSPETNAAFVRCFFDHAFRDPLTDEIGKTICFAVSRRHATKLVAAFNAEAARRWPEVYGAGSAFAVQVTSDQPGAQGMTLDFANNNLLGRSRWRAAEFPDYETSRARVCVTVGMMTTGYDCQDLLNVVLARPIFSPTDFIQIKGRGTRLHTFVHPASGASAEKSGFALFDFFANCEFFEKTFDYDRKLELPKPKPPRDDEDEAGGAGDEVTPPRPDSFHETSPDELRHLDRQAVGPDGMRIDREMYRQRFADAARDAASKHPELAEAVRAENWPEAETLATRLLFDRPADFWNLKKLADTFRSDRAPSLREILEVVFGLRDHVATREELAEDAFQSYLAAHATDATKIRELRTVFLALLLDGEAQGFIESGNFPALRTRDPALYQCLKPLGGELLKQLSDHVRMLPKEPFTRATG